MHAAKVVAQWNIWLRLLFTSQQGAWKGSVRLPEVFWAEFRLQELEKLLSPNGIFQHFVDSKTPASNSSLTRFLTVPTHTKTHYTYTLISKNNNTIKCVFLKQTWPPSPRTLCHLISRGWRDQKWTGTGHSLNTAQYNSANYKTIKNRVRDKREEERGN